MLVLDLDTFVAEPRTLKLGGKDFDLSIIPFEYSLRMYDLIPVVEKLDKSERLAPEEYAQLIDLFALILGVDRVWLNKQINATRFTEITSFIFRAMYEDGKKNGTEQGKTDASSYP